MSTVTTAVTPFHDHSRRRRLTKVIAWLVGIALVVVVLELLGIDVVRLAAAASGTQLHDGRRPSYIVAGLALQTVQTTLRRRSRGTVHPARRLSRRSDPVLRRSSPPTPRASR